MIRYVQTKPLDFATIENAFQESIKTNTFTNNGPLKRRLERLLHAYFGLDKTKTVVCTSSGTSALYIACMLLEQVHGERIKWVTPAFNFPAAVVNRLNTEIVDIDPETYTIPDNIQADGYIIPTLFGTTPDLELWENKDGHLILDNASSPLTTYKGKNINAYGDISIGSLHHTKFLGYGEGGYLVVDAEHEAATNALLNFGFEDSRKYNTNATNAKMSDVSAAFILQHISQYDIEQHMQLQTRYLAQVAGINGVEVFNQIPQDDFNRLVYGNMPLIFERPIDHLVFRDVGIEANKYYKPLIDAPNSKALFERIINLPLHAGLTNYEMELILKKVEYEANLTK